MNDDDLREKLLAEFDNHSDDEEESDTAHIGLIPLEFLFIKGLRSTSKLIWIPEEECLFYSNVRSERYDAIAYTCYQKKCTARVYLREDGSAFKTHNSIHSNHGSMYHIFKEMQCINTMKEKCNSASASVTIREIFNDAVLE